MSAVVKTMDPFRLLLDIEARCRRNALGIPQQIEVRRTWSGIGFRVGGNHLVSRLGEVREILEYPVLTRVPGAQSWVKGIANVRGNLLPIMDLQGFLSGVPAEIGRRTRVLVIRHGDLTAGLVVDEVMGLRHFFEEEWQEAGPDVPGLDGYLKGGYRQAGALWGVFSMRALAESQEFLYVAHAR